MYSFAICTPLAFSNYIYLWIIQVFWLHLDDGSYSFRKKAKTWWVVPTPTSCCATPEGCLPAECRQAQATIWHPLSTDAAFPYSKCNESWSANSSSLLQILCHLYTSSIQKKWIIRCKSVLTSRSVLLFRLLMWQKHSEIVDKVFINQCKGGVQRSKWNLRNLQANWRKCIWFLWSCF